MLTETAIRATSSAPLSQRKLFWAFFRLSLQQYRHSFTSVFMTFGVPLLFLLIYALSFHAWSGTANVMIAVQGDASPATYGRLGTAFGGNLLVTRSAESPEAILEARRALLVLVQDGPILTIHARPSEEPMAALLMQYLTAAEVAAADSASRAVRVMIAERPQRNVGFLPGIVLMALLNLGLFAAGGKLLQERGSGALRLYRQFPVSLTWFFGAELATKLLLAVAQSMALLWLGVALFDVHLGVAAMGLTALVCSLSAIAMLSLGYALGATLPRVGAGQHILTTLNLLMVFLGDLFFPLSQLGWARPLVAVLPSAHAANLLRNVLLDAPPSFPVLLSVAVLLFYAGGCMWIAVRHFRFTARP